MSSSLKFKYKDSPLIPPLPLIAPPAATASLPYEITVLSLLLPLARQKVKRTNETDQTEKFHNHFNLFMKNTLQIGEEGEKHYLSRASPPLLEADRYLQKIEFLCALAVHSFIATILII